ncbi:glutamate receptor ionotropic, NMDA 3A-like isoform X2 [Hydractinia symbiolongicarpus]|uniref:glutamate receptor ionotropic, NMDA 3A-like isoform X2 n=1 Tax=Hydractinia symbiolongicarpus TaxID=13093 RepID=UPI0025517435|nr:glutamate receptor ionotropic, NMDA 3A-like isoform X2 [Hydractinia symbiolongicarpus]
MGLLGCSIYLFTFYLLFFNVKLTYGNTKLVHSENIACHILKNSHKNNDSFQIVSLKEDNGLLDLLNVSKESINLYTILPKPSNNLIGRWRGYYGLFHVPGGCSGEHSSISNVQRNLVDVITSNILKKRNAVQSIQIVTSEVSRNLSVYKIIVDQFRWNNVKTSRFHFQTYYNYEFVNLLDRLSDRSVVFLMLWKCEILLFLDILQKYNLPEGILWIVPSASDDISKRYPGIHVVDARKLLVNCQKQISFKESVTCSVYAPGQTLQETSCKNTIDLPKDHTKRKLRVFTVLAPPFAVEVPDNLIASDQHICFNSVTCNIPETPGHYRKSCCSGLSLELFDAIAKKLKLSYDLFIPEDGLYGGFHNGSWNGVIGEIHRGEADVGAQVFAPNEARSHVVDFTEHFMISSIAVIMRKSSKKELGIVNWKFVQVYEKNFIFLIGAMITSAILFAFAFENIWAKIRDKRLYSISMSYLFFCGLTLQRDIAGKVPKRWSTRLLSIIYSLSILIIMTTYTAQLTKTNVFYGRNTNVNGIKDQKILSPSLKFKFGVEKGTVTESYFQYSNIKTFSNVYQYLEQHLISPPQSGFELVHTGKLDAYIGDYVYDFHRIATKEFCSDLTIIQDDTYVTSYTFPVRKNSKLKEKLSDEIRTMKNNGRAANIIDKWLGNVNCSTMEPGADKFSWQYAGGLLVLMGASLALGLVVILCEKFYIQFLAGRKL